LEWLATRVRKELILTRQEHLDWCKKRALELLDLGDRQQAVISMLADLRKHPELQNHPGGMIGTMMLLGGFLETNEEIRKWINGFN
jgi:hypothetical protein